MARGLQAAAAGALLLGSSACNLVVSEEPWFTDADAVPAPAMHDGLWLGAAADCRYDESRPAEHWPDCADATFVRGDERWSMRWESVEGRGRRRRTFVGWEPAEPDPIGELLVANGDHLLGQSQDGEPGPEESADSSAEDDRLYTYYGLRPVRRDDAGALLEVEIWLVQCGPLPEPAPRKRRRDGEERESAPSVTDRPFPGLTVVDDNCVAESAQAVRQAAVFSESLGPPYRLRWIRDGWR
jgi:hypothetical protein